jgi:hypothetical protein
MPSTSLNCSRTDRPASKSGLAEVRNRIHTLSGNSFLINIITIILIAPFCKRAASREHYHSESGSAFLKNKYNPSGILVKPGIIGPGPRNRESGIGKKEKM